jgi:hypothetical protein
MKKGEISTYLSIITLIVKLTLQLKDTGWLIDLKMVSQK